jgi:hypothetical protein
MIFGKAKRAGTSCSTPSASAIHGHIFANAPPSVPLTPMVGAAVNMHHISFLNDDAEAQQRIIKHLIAPYAKGDFHQEYLHEHAGGRLSAFLKKDLIKIRPTNNSSLWHRAAAHLINAFIKKDANKYFTEIFPYFIQTAG